MYSRPAASRDALYLRVRAADGRVIDDNAAFYVAPYKSGDAVAGEACFNGELAPCRDYFTRVARWLEQPITLELWRWDYQTDARRLIASMPFAP